MRVNCPDHLGAALQYPLAHHHRGLTPAEVPHAAAAAAVLAAAVAEAEWLCGSGGGGGGGCVSQFTT